MDSWLAALVESPVIVVPVLAWGSAAAAAATASSETVVTVSWLAELSAGVAGLVEFIDLSDEAAGCWVWAGADVSEVVLAVDSLVAVWVDAGEADSPDWVAAG